MNERLYRSVDDRVIAGVAGGLADRMGIDPTIVRVIWALLIVASGGVFLAIYVVMALVVPEEDDLGSFSPMAPGGTGGAVPGATGGPGGAGAPPPPAAPGWASHGVSSGAQARAQARAERRAARAARRSQEGPGRSGVIVGIVLIALGAWFLIREYVPALDFDRIWPVLLLVLGLALVLFSFGGGRSGGSGGRTGRGGTFGGGTFGGGTFGGGSGPGGGSGSGAGDGPAAGGGPA